MKSMEVRAVRLPPLPNKKQPINPIDYPPTPQQPSIHHRVGSFSREKKLINNQQKNSNDRKVNRPTSARSFSRESIQSRDSRYSRGSSREKSTELSNKVNYNAKIRISMPSVSAKSWAVYQMKQEKFIYGKRTFKKRQIASLTKMMNLITILDIVKDQKLETGKLKVRVSRQASYINGTTAQLKEGMSISLYDLFFGMMLPSGNDASFQAAQIGGSLLIMQKLSEETRDKIIYNIDKMTQFYQSRSECVKIFIAHMNRISKKIGMQNSNFANTHGLSNPQNYSCAQDLCKLATFCMQNQIFRYIVATQYYHFKYRAEVIQDYAEEFQGQDEEDLSKKVKVFEDRTLKWENTNKMLQQGWSGIKTGITPNAGPCLAASVTKFLNGKSFSFLVILICSASMQARWKQVKDIIEWVVEEKLYI